MSEALPAIVPVPAESLPDHYQRAIAAQKKAARRERSYGNAKTLLIVGLAGLSGWLAWRNEQLVALAANNANRVIFNTMRDDGVLVNTSLYTALPARFQTDNTLNSLWWYVQWRECYSAAEAPRAHYAVQKMSAEGVKKEWVAFISPNNPRSPQITLGKRNAHYFCEPVQYTPIGSDGDRYGFRFMRYEVDSQGKRDAGVMMYAPLAFRTGIYDTGENGWKDRVTFNAAGIQVWEYRGGEPEAIQIHLQQPRVAGAGR